MYLATFACNTACVLNYITQKKITCTILNWSRPQIDLRNNAVTVTGPGNINIDHLMYNVPTEVHSRSFIHVT